MNEAKSIAPVVFIIFNRPDLTESVFREIEKARPGKLFIIADGPRADRANEAEKCAETRKVVETITWDCEVFRNYSDANLGCRKRISSGLDWVFSQTDRAIIIEDDCLPDPSFFPYCTELLEKYENDDRVGSINGSNFTHGRVEVEDSYYFSRYPLIWGWATWRRVWKNYDVSIKHWGTLRENNWLNTVANPSEFEHWIKAFNRVYDGGLDAWGYQFTFSQWLQRQISIQPKGNLISNLGFRADATHTSGSNNVADLPRQALEFPLRHPQVPALNFLADDIYMREHCYRKKKEKGLKRIWGKVFPK
ncbi:Hemolytic protein HlpA-like protein [Neorhizobium galegae bv. orientalis]|nr:Hemolytic protein HlpA-like protein [Neorhizobium galegae bv. orientalis]